MCTVHCWWPNYLLEVGNPVRFEFYHLMMSLVSHLHILSYLCVCHWSVDCLHTRSHDMLNTLYISSYLWTNIFVHKSSNTPAIVFTLSWSLSMTIIITGNSNIIQGPNEGGWYFKEYLVSKGADSCIIRIKYNCYWYVNHLHSELCQSCLASGLSFLQ